jgi:hypothetical protein
MDGPTQLKIARLIGLLGSDYEGEIINAARAIRQLLESKGLTFADLKQTVEKPALPAVPEPRERRRDWDEEEDERRRERQRRAWDEEVERRRAEQQQRNDVIVEARAILRHSLRLLPHELKFVKQMLAQAEFTRRAMTEKQANWFAYLVSRYGDDDDRD